MAITRRTIVDQVICDPEFGTVLWREAIVVEEDGEELVRTYKRGSVEVDATAPANMPALVAPFRVLVDTPEARQRAADARNRGRRGR